MPPDFGEDVWFIAGCVAAVCLVGVCVSAWHGARDVVLLFGVVAPVLFGAGVAVVFAGRRLAERRGSGRR